MKETRPLSHACGGEEIMTFEPCNISWGQRSGREHTHRGKEGSMAAVLLEGHQLRQVILLPSDEAPAVHRLLTNILKHTQSVSESDPGSISSMEVILVLNTATRLGLGLSAVGRKTLQCQHRQYM